MHRIAFSFFWISIASCAYGHQLGAPLFNPAKLFKKNETRPATVAVQKGDTLYSISRAHKLPVQAIVQRNKLTPPYTLKIGQLINLPHPYLHKVKAGETVFSLSQKYGVDLKSIIRDNDLVEPYILGVGDNIRIPKSARYIPRPHITVEDETGKIVALRKPSSRPTIKAPPAQLKSAIATPKPKTPWKKPSPMVIKHQAPKLTGGAKPRFLMPVKGRIVGKYGPQGGGKHNDGINILAARGSKVLAAENGVIVYAGNELRGFGNLILIKHANGWTSAYAHMDKMSIRKGQTVKRGDTIGTVGMTGHINKPQLHFELRRKSKTINPQAYV